MTKRTYPTLGGAASKQALPTTMTAMTDSDECFLCRLVRAAMRPLHAAVDAACFLAVALVRGGVCPQPHIHDYQYKESRGTFTEVDECAICGKERIRDTYPR